MAMPRTARGRAGGNAKAGHMSQEEMYIRDVLRAAARATTPKVKHAPAFRPWQSLGRYRIGNILHAGNGEYKYTLVDVRTLNVTGWISADDVYAILILDALLGCSAANCR